MAELTIAQLTELLAANVDNADLLPIWDDTAAETKKITISNFRTAVGVSNWAESFSSATQATSRWIPSNAAANVNAAIVPKGTGAITASIPDGTATGGNARGAYAVDLQMVRNNANQVAASANSVIIGGQRNRISASATGEAFVGGGFSNTVGDSAYRGVIVGGSSNTITNSEAPAFIGAGNANSITSRGNRSAIVAGETNSITEYNCFIGAGSNNSVGGQHCVVVGGSGNSTGGQVGNLAFSFIGGGSSNQANSTYLGVIGGGNGNNITNSSFSAILGGRQNTAQGWFNFIGGGQSNTGTSASAVTTQSATTTNASTAVTLSGSNSNILVGQLITGTGIANYTYVAAISGTSLTLSQNANASGTNTLSFFAAHGVVVGGGNNQATGAYSFIGGGGDAGTAANRNAASGDWSVVVGGSLNTASAAGSTVIGGYNATSRLYGQVSHASGQFSTRGDAQAHELIWRRLVAGAPVGGSELFLDGASAAAILPATNSVWHGIIDCVAICTATGDGTTVVGDVEATSYKVTIKRIGTTTSLVGTVQEIGTTNADASMATAVFTIDNNDTNESLRIVFTSPTTAGSTTNIRCVATFRGTQIQY